MTTTTIRPCGEAALLLECADLAEAVALAARVERLRPDAVDVVAAARTVLVTARGPSQLPELRRRIEELLARGPADPVADARGTEQSAAAAGAVTLDVRYDGPDLADVAGLAGMSVEALVRVHTSIPWRAAFGGFAPGFSYLVDARELGAVGPAREPSVDGPALEPGSVGPAPGRLPAIPRLDSPRQRVPAGSVAVADRFCAVYPGASPGGWRLLGTTEALLWALDRPEPALIPPGTSVRFRAIDGPDAGGRGVTG